MDFKITPATNASENSPDKKPLDADNSFNDDHFYDSSDFSDMSSDSTDGGMGKGMGPDMPGCTPVDPSTFRRQRRQANIRMVCCNK